MVGGMQGCDWKADKHPGDRIEALERESAQLKAVIEQQKETNERNFGLVIEQATLIEVLRDTLKCIVPSYQQGRFTGEIEMHRVCEALQQYELWKESK
jgi:hypothetical protein